MALWTRLFNRPNYEGEIANPANPAAGDVGPGVTPGDPNGVEIVGERSAPGILPYPQASPWGGYPAEWSTPAWTSDFSSRFGLSKLIDTAWNAIDLNASVLASFPAYILKNGKILSQPGYLSNPDPLIYNSWFEFCKQLFWDFQLGEAFVLPMEFSAGPAGTTRYPTKFRVIPPYLMNIELRGGKRHYNVGALDCTDEILHIRYISNTADAHGHGPLEAAGARMTTAGLLQRYAERIAETGGTPLYWLEVAKSLTKKQADEMLDIWLESRRERAGQPAVASGGAQLKQALSMSAKDMTLLELSQFTEARIAVCLGVPPFLLGLPMATGESLTYANASQLFDFHERASLGPKSTAVMQAMSNWLLPRGKSIEQNRADYSRPDMLARAQAYQIFNAIRDDQGRPALSAQEIRAMERFNGEYSAEQLSGAEVSGSPVRPDLPPPVGEDTPAPVSSRPAAVTRGN
jgi:HK97 family phage portal protein